VAGADSACLPQNPSHPTYSTDSLRSLFISYLYLIKWVKWNPFFVAHGSLVSGVLCLAGRLIPDLPMVMEVATLSSDILAYHPDLVGGRVHSQVHPAFVDRSLSSVLLPIGGLLSRDEALGG
jgi:hypothetical protein